MDETPAQARLRAYQTIRTFGSGTEEEREALDRSLHEEFGVGRAQAFQSSQFESFHVVVLEKDGTVVQRYDEPVDAILFDTAVELGAAVTAAEADHPGRWVEGIAILHGGRPWCLVRPLNRPMDARTMLETVMDDIAASTRVEPIATVEAPLPAFARAA